MEKEEKLLREKTESLYNRSINSKRFNDKKNNIAIPDCSFFPVFLSEKGLERRLKLSQYKEIKYVLLL